MKDRRDKILDVAISLAEQGGFDNVRQRDVAANAGIALGTLYKSFRSKEDILSAALEREVEVLERKMETTALKGDDALERVTAFFQSVTRILCRKPNYARAVIRAMTAGEPEVAANVAKYQGRMNGLIVTAIRGPRPGTTVTDDPPTEQEIMLAFYLQQIWFSCLVGWSAALFGQQQIIDHVRAAAKLLLRGMESAER